MPFKKGQPPPKKGEKCRPSTPEQFIPASHGSVMDRLAEVIAMLKEREPSGLTNIRLDLGELALSLTSIADQLIRIQARVDEIDIEIGEPDPSLEIDFAAPETKN